MKIIAWNIGSREEAWRHLLDTDADIALLQEAAAPPADVSELLEIDPAPWRTEGAGLHRPWRAAVVRLSDRVGLEWIEAKSVVEAHSGDLAVSRLGTLTAAIATFSANEPLVVASLYAPWEKPHNMTGRTWIYADASAHRVVSDLSTFIGQEARHRVLAAGDLNILHGYGEQGSVYWAARYATVFSRMMALGCPFVGPQVPNGRHAEPWPDELPRDSNNVPTYHTSHQYQRPATATRQLDFVFASTGLAESVRVRALNEPEHWGPSDHCRVEIEIS